MIVNGKDLNFGQSASGLPDVAQAIQQMFQPATIGIIENTQINGRTQTIIAEYITTQGVRVHNSNPLEITKTGERFWKSSSIYFLNNIVLSPDDLFIFNGTQYRVLVVENWTEYGFNRYHAVEDYSQLYNPMPNLI